MRNLSDHFAYSLIIIINIQWIITRWGGQRPNICQSRDRSEQWPAQQGRILLQILLHIHLLLEWALRWSEALGQYKVDRAARREGRILGESSPGSHRVHTLYTHTVQTVHQNQFFHKNCLYTHTVQTVYQNQLFHKNCLQITDCTVSTQYSFNTTSDTKWRNLSQELSNLRVKIGGITDSDSLLMKWI